MGGAVAASALNHILGVVVSSRAGSGSGKRGVLPVITSVRAELEQARKQVPVVPGPDHTGVRIDGSKAEREEKKNFAQAFSDRLALAFADALRPDFAGILPARDDKGGVVKGTESPARTLKGVKRLDVNYSTIHLGLGLGVSIKTLNFRDPRSARYTKSVSRIDNELRAEAGDYHERQPFAVLCAVVFLPMDAAADGEVSSFAHAALTLRFRTGRKSHRDGPELFERLFVVLYESADDGHLGDVVCFDASLPPPKTGLPRAEDRTSLPQLMDEIKAAFYERNVPRKIFADSPEDGDKSEELENLERTDPQLFAPDDQTDE